MPDPLLQVQTSRSRERRRRPGTRPDLLSPPVGGRWARWLPHSPDHVSLRERKDLRGLAILAKPPSQVQERASTRRTDPISFCPPPHPRRVRPPTTDASRSALSHPTPDLSACHALHFHAPGPPAPPRAANGSHLRLSSYEYLLRSRVIPFDSTRHKIPASAHRKRGRDERLVGGRPGGVVVASRQAQTSPGRARSAGQAATDAG